jgi:Phage tail sheath protein subtilisin-like domain/Phage tail sheath C-terminal domain
MAYQLSPGVAWSEIDLTTVVPAVSTTGGAFAGNFDWGPIDEVVLISNEVELVSWFGKPSNNTAVSFFTAANFLAYGDNLSVIRSANTNQAKNATSGNTGAIIKNRDDWDLNWSTFNTNDPKYGMIAGRWAGSIGNGLRVCVFANAGVGFSDAAWTSWEQAAQFSGPPGTSDYVAARGGANDEMHVIVLDTQGYFTGGIANSVLERYSNLSKAVDATNDDGSSNYWASVLADRSSFVWAINNAISNTTLPVIQTSTWGNTAQGTAFTQANASYNFTLTNGLVAAPNDGQLQNSYVTFSDSDAYDISLIMTGGSSNVVCQYVIDNIAEPGGTYGRGDCVVFVSPQYDDVVNQPGSEVVNSVTTRNFYGSSSYAFMDSGWKKQFDKYNNVYRWIPLNGDVAGLCARTDQTRDAWFSPAGLNRGTIKNVTKLAWMPTKADRDALYSNGINPVVTFKGDGTVLYGDKTLLSKPSAFDRINVRRLFIVLEKSISRAAKYSLFEFNDDFTRSQFVALVEPFLRDVKGRRGIYDFKVVCDDTNNTQQVIDSNQFVGDIYIKPARSINFIQLNFVAVRTGVAFSEVVGQF